MAVVLPWQFDTSPVVRMIMRGVLGLLFVVVVPGILYSLLVSHRTAAAIQLLLTGGVIAYFGHIIAGNLAGTRGTITADAVVFEPGTLYGIRLSGPAGRFPIRQFRAVLVERMMPLAMAQGGPHERVSLAGKDGTPDILIARTQRDAGRSLGQELATALGLPYEERRPPY